VGNISLGLASSYSWLAYSFSWLANMFALLGRQLFSYFERNKKIDKAKIFWQT